MTNDVLHIRTEQDPQEFSVNIRFGGGHVVPPGTRKAMDALKTASKARASDQGFTIGATEYVCLDITFAFGSWRSDLDNPLKRVLDALSEALRFNDNRVVEIHLYRRTVGDGNQYIDLVVHKIPESDVPSPIGHKRPKGNVWVG